MLNVNELVGFGVTGSGKEEPHLYWRVVIDDYADAPYNYAAVIGELEFRATVGGVDQCNGGTATASRSYSSFTPDRAFNNTFANDGWMPVAVGVSGKTAVGDWVAYQHTTPVKVLQIQLSHTILFGTVCPHALTLQYSDEGVAWVTSTSWTFTPPALNSSITLNV